ncbi:MAG: outer membrane lipid asymmetry maintenance protein MlaD [Opitutales bacterium]|nr:outer membrane lipid asymmetry maintenance protein MlaD [Opitutales bacterium]
MRKLKIETLVGLFVLVGLVAIAYLSIKIGGARFFGGDHYELQARFTNVGGLNRGADVRIGGVSIGQVTEVRLDHETFAAMVRFRVPVGLELEDDTIASIRTSGLIGDRFISLSPGGSGIVLAPGDILFDTESAIELESLISRFAFGSVED